MQICFYCGEGKGVLLFGRLPLDEEAPRQVCTDHEPCDKCKAFMAQGIICIGVDEAKSGGDTQVNPYRDGNWCVITEEGMRRFVNADMADEVAKKRVAFVSSDVWEMAGLPKARGSGASHRAKGA